jgi:hypothetical protein
MAKRGSKSVEGVEQLSNEGIDDISNVDAGNKRVVENESIGGIPIVDIAESADSTEYAGSGGDTAKRKRGRPAGSGKSAGRKGKEKAAPVSVKGIEKVLYSLHAMAAAALKVEELELDQDEAKLLAEAVTEVASYYNTTVDPKILAWAGLIGVCGQLYGPRFAAYKMRKSFSDMPKKQAMQEGGALMPMGDGTFSPLQTH